MTLLRTVGRWQPVLQRKYAHMCDADRAVWEAWLLTHGPELLSVDYDVHVAGNRQPPDGHSTSIKRDWSALTSKRIDVVGYRYDEVWIIEVKRHALWSAVGQLLTYRMLWEAQWTDPRPTRMVLVCETVDQDLMVTLTAHGITVSRAAVAPGT